MSIYPLVLLRELAWQGVLVDGPGISLWRATGSLRTARYCEVRWLRALSTPSLHVWPQRLLSIAFRRPNAEGR